MTATSTTNFKKSIPKNKVLRFGDLEIVNLIPDLSEEEFIDFCLHNPNLKIEQDKTGNLIIMSPVSLDSGNYESEIGIDLGLWNRKTKLGKTYSSSTMFILPDGEKRMPDAAWISKEKVKKLSRWQRKKIAKIVPDFIVEVRSPTDKPKDLKAKIKDIWIKNGVQLAWLIDPIKEVHWIFRIDGSQEKVEGMDAILTGEKVLPDFKFDLSILIDEED